jgi:hypothetical protein
MSRARGEHRARAVYGTVATKDDYDNDERVEFGGALTRLRSLKLEAPGARGPLPGRVYRPPLYRRGPRSPAAGPRSSSLP